ncbi:MAG: OmpA family protein, partial [Oleispira sp.]|nr:OmpA family protein [Oleispira sp.]
DGTPNKEEKDAVPPTDPTNPDTDNDGICDGVNAIGTTCTPGPDENPTDACIPSTTVGACDADKDGETNDEEINGTPATNPNDPDSDGDGICDGSNAVPAKDGFKGCMPNEKPGTDTDGDGVNDDVEGSTDSDGDLIPDYLDPDGDGPAPDYGDSDKDGINDKEECGPALPCRDSDKDGIYDYLDTDSDNDGISDDEEADGIAGNGDEGTNTPKDSDGDGTPDYRDEDSDNDGTLDRDEVNTPHDPANPKDSDDDGIPDVIDHDDGAGETGGQTGGGDSDNDGLTDEEECPNYPSNCPDSDGDGKPDYLDNNNDTDDDGISDNDEDSNLDGDNNPATNPRDTDGDGTADYLDTDSDNDGKLDVDERDEPYDASNPRDTDNDGIPDVIDVDDGTEGSDNEGSGAGDSDNDGIPDDVECGTAPCRDTDNDGIPDYTDIDSDNDGVLDEDEAGEDPTKPKDTDGDGIPDVADPTNGGEGEKGGDSDGDGVADADECNSWPNCVDTDNDGIADYLDPDSSPVVVTPAPAPEKEELGTIKTGVHGAGSIHWVFALMLSLLVALRRKSAIVIALPMLLASWASSAEWWDEMDLYVGAGIGQSYLDPSIDGTGYTIDNHTQNAWKLTGGWDWNDHISFEAYYADLGSVDLDPDADLGYRMVGGDAMLHYWAYGAERMEGSIAVYAKAGLNHMTNNGNGVSYESNNQGQLFGGIGAEWYLPQKFSVRFEIESYDTDASLFSLNLVKRFGFKSKKSIVSKPSQYEFVAMVEELPETAAGPKIVLLAPVVLDSDLDGLLDDEDQCPNTAKGVTIDGLGCASFAGKIGDLIAKIQFESRSASLTEASKVELDDVVRVLGVYSAVKVEVQAHSDNIGSDKYNKFLSQQRAESVVAYLTAEGIDPGRMSALGYGEEKPVAENETEAGRAENRRVEFILKAH